MVSRLAVPSPGIAEFHARLCREHVEEGEFLWQIRRRAVHGSLRAFRELIDLDGGLAAHIDGIRIAGPDASAWCNALINPVEPGELFLAAITALETGGDEQLHALIDASQSPVMADALMSAFGWVSPRVLEGRIRTMLHASSPWHRTIAIACCAMHRVDCGSALAEAMADSEPALRARALRAAGELGRVDLLQTCQAHVQDQHPECAFWASWSAALLGGAAHVREPLIEAIVSPGPQTTRALVVALTRMPMPDILDLLRGVAQEPSARRVLILGAGISGDPAYVPWLIEQMADRAHCRIAGDSFTLITGANLVADHLERTGSQGSNDDDDESVDMDPDEGVPWPDQQRVRDWWAANHPNYQAGARHLLGRPPTRPHCLAVMKSGTCLQRKLAAHYLVAPETGTSLFNTSAPAWRQQRALSQIA